MAHVIGVLEVVETLNRAEVKFVLAGAHAIGGWTGRPRATEDVDVIVAVRHHRKAVQALLAAFPQLRTEEHPAVTRLRDRVADRIAIDVMKSTEPIFKAALKYRQPTMANDIGYFIPTLEMALALKFAPMVSPTREDDKKHFDVGDFIGMIRHNTSIDLVLLAQLGELVYSGGGKEIVELVRRVRAGEPLAL